MGFPTRPGPVALFSFTDALKVGLEPRKTFMSFVLRNYKMPFYWSSGTVQENFRLLIMVPRIIGSCLALYNLTVRGLTQALLLH